MRSPRSLEAIESLDPSALSAQERMVISAIIVNDGATTYEIEEYIKQYGGTGKHQSVSATVNKLWHVKKVIRPSGMTRPTDTGRRANVMEIGSEDEPDAPKEPGKDQPDTVQIGMM